MAFAPRDNPQIAIAVVIENAGYGASWAAPIASLMIEKYVTGTVSRTDIEQRMKEANLIPNLKSELAYVKAEKEHKEKRKNAGKPAISNPSEVKNADFKAKQDTGRKH